MLYGLYLSAQGAQARATQLEVTANNIANAGTSGFKRDMALFQSHLPFDVANGSFLPTRTNAASQTGGLTVAQTVTDQSQGSLTKTDEPLDAALAGPGYFRVTDGTNELLTRDGRFTLNAAGELVTADHGERVLSTSGTPIVVAPDATGFTITTDGVLSQQFVNGASEPVARLGVVLPEIPASVQKLGNNRLRATGGTLPAGAETRVMQGMTEASGVNPVIETMGMIEASRQFESNVNLMRMQDESLGHLLSAVRP